MKDDHDDIKDFDFETWSDLFTDRARRLGYEGPIDVAGFEDVWDSGQSPEKAAEDFVSEMTS